MHPSLTRRSVLKLSGVAAAVAASPLAVQQVTSAATGSSPTAVPHFAVDLPIVPVLKPYKTEGTTDYYKITSKPATLDILPGHPTAMWGYQGIVPGPTLRTAGGRTPIVEHVNGLKTDLVTHLHGVSALPKYDGYPYDTAAPGHSKLHKYPVQKTGATYWYHDHTADVTAEHVYRGLSAFHIAEGSEAAQELLPSGDRDVALHIDHKVINGDGALVLLEMGQSMTDGQTAGRSDDKISGAQEVVLVNGAPWPRMSVTNRLYRLRLLNASANNPMVLKFSQAVPVWVVATEGGLVPKPIAVTSLRLAQAERYELLVDFGKVSPGTSVTLQDTSSWRTSSNILRFDVKSGPKEDLKVPSALHSVVLPDTSDVARTRTWNFTNTKGVWTINGLAWDRNRIDAFPAYGSTEIWEVHNATGMVHPVHPHMVNIQILSRNGKAPLPYERGVLKDVCWVSPGETVRLAMTFTPNRGLYVFHCHNMIHEDNMMMTQFKVV